MSETLLSRALCKCYAPSFVCRLRPLTEIGCFPIDIIIIGSHKQAHIHPYTAQFNSERKLRRNNKKNEPDFANCKRTALVSLTSLECNFYGDCCNGFERKYFVYVCLSVCVCLYVFLQLCAIISYCYAPFASLLNQRLFDVIRPTLLGELFFCTRSFFEWTVELQLLFFLDFTSFN